MATENKQSDFERSLFRDGVSNIDTETYCSTKLNPRSYELRAPFLPWLNKFKGKIPKRWAAHWGNVLDDFNGAGKREVQLSSTLIDAGVWHPHWLVVGTVFHTQRLTPEQMATAFSANSNFIDELPNVQRALGVTEADIQEAKLIFFDNALWQRYMGISDIPLLSAPFRLL